MYACRKVCKCAFDAPYMITDSHTGEPEEPEAQPPALPLPPPPTLPLRLPKPPPLLLPILPALLSDAVVPPVVHVVAAVAPMPATPTPPPMPADIPISLMLFTRRCCSYNALGSVIDSAVLLLLTGGALTRCPGGA